MKTRSGKNIPKKKIENSINDSVIVITDSDTESNNQEMKWITDTKQNKTDTHETLRRSIRCLNNICKQNKISDSTMAVQQSRKRKRNLMERSNSNISCLVLSDTEDLDMEVVPIYTDNENIEPLQDRLNQMNKDVEVIWASTKSKLVSKTKETFLNNTEEAVTTESNFKPFFYIDDKPDYKNLELLTSKSTHKRKKRKLNPVRPGKHTDANNICPKNVSLHNKSKKKNVGNKQADCVQQNHKEINSEASTSCCTNGSTKSQETTHPGRLREIVIDGSSIAMAHTNGKSFSEAGLKLVIDYFKNKGHTVKAFVPQYRRSLQHQLLEQLYTEGTVVFTPSRRIGGKRITPYDDRYIIEYATMCEGIVVSQDQYRDLYMENPAWRDTIAKRLLTPTFVGDYVMFPQDPLGRRGPTLDEFLRY